MDICFGERGTQFDPTQQNQWNPTDWLDGGEGLGGKGETKGNIHEQLGGGWCHLLSNSGGETGLEEEGDIFILRCLWRSKWDQVAVGHVNCESSGWR